MKQSRIIQCPHCEKEQKDTLDDLVEGGDMYGSFEHACDNCRLLFTIAFEYRPYIQTSK